MNKAYDAKFGKLTFRSYIFSIPRFFFLKKVLIVFLSLFTCFIFAKEGYYEEKDISLVMQRLFGYHVENKELNNEILRKTIKIYLEQIDSDKIYLLEKEAASFLELSDKQINQMIDRINKEDFSDFYRLNEIINKALTRARSWRERLYSSIQDQKTINRIENIDFAKNEKELVNRQTDHFLRFYQIQKKRSFIDSVEKQKKVFDLYVKKMNRYENDYLINSDKNKQIHYFVLHFLKAFSKSLDAHTYFFSEEEAREMKISLEKKFEGVGVVLTETIEGVIITDVVKNSPAEESKQIKEGDLLVEINQKNVKNYSFDEVLKAMKQKEKGKLELGLQRKNRDKLIKVTLVSRPISMDNERLSFTYETFEDGIIGKLVLKSFYESQDGVSSEKDIKEAINSLRKIGNLKGIVLDFRDNAGGFLSQAVKVSGLFLSNGVVVMSKYYNKEIKYLRNLETNPFYNGPLVILTSKMAASAAEIVAQALQDYGVALIVGDERTFGKGSIQYQTVTSDNTDFYFKVTIGKYYTVSGKTTQIEGVKADIVVPTIYAPFEIGERYLENSLQADTIEPAFTDSLQDLEPKLKKLFQKAYLPNQQKTVLFWKKMIPLLTKNSQARIAKSVEFQAFLKNQEEIRRKIKSASGEIFLKEKDLEFRDLPIQEAVNIVKDMILIEDQTLKILNQEFHNLKK